MKHIEKLWQSYKKDVMKDRFTESQIIDTRLAFFSCASALFYIMMRMAENENVTQEQGAAFLDEINSEIEEFRNDVSTKDFASFAK
jgi:hypothetical protein